MNRRKFVKNSMGGAVAASLGSSQLLGANLKSNPNSFQLKYAPHLGMFKHHAGDDPVDQLKFMAEQGFRAFEDNGMKKRSVSDQERMAQYMTSAGIEMGVFVAHSISWQEPNLAKGDEESRELFLKEIKESVEVAKRVHAKWMTVVPGHQDLRQPLGYQQGHVVESLKRAAGILEPHGLVMVLEPLNFRNHPGLFLSKMDQAYTICQAVGSPSCKILCDLYHQQITEGDLIPNIDAAWEEIAYFQVGDNPGRKEPTTGEINYLNIFRHLHAKGFEGIIGMEHGNSQEGKAGGAEGHRSLQGCG